MMIVFAFSRRVNTFYSFASSSISISSNPISAQEIVVVFILISVKL